jgi:MerR family transcriptional regulator, heat shock protein HspR
LTYIFQSSDSDEPVFVISVAARMVNLHPQTLRTYELMGLVKPARSQGNIRLYSASDIERLRQITRLTDELGVNLAGVEVILHMRQLMDQMRRDMERMQQEHAAEVERLRRQTQRSLPMDERR